MAAVEPLEQDDRADPPLGARAWLATRQSRPYLLIMTFAAALWLLGVPAVNPAQLGDLGLGALLPATSLFALLVLTACFFYALQAHRWPQWVPALTLVVVVVLLFGLTAMTESEARFAPVWRHIGYTDYIIRHGALDTKLDAYFTWPGFFLILAMLTQLTGLPNLLGVANWAPVFFNLLYLPPLYWIYSILTTNRRVVWLGLWMFVVNNWIGQDYLAPQALGVFFFLAGLAVVLRWFRLTGVGGRLRLSALEFHYASGEVVHRTLLLTAFLFLFAGLVLSHPLTPFFELAAIAGLVLVRKVGPWWLPVLMGVMMLDWTVFMGQDFLAGHAGLVTEGVGHVNSTLATSLVARITGSPGHLAVVLLRMISTGAIWLLAGIGLLRRRRKQMDAIVPGLLAVIPLPLLLLQAYGGEILLRIDLFALPFVAFLAAQALHPAPRWLTGWLRPAGLCVIASVFAFSFLFTKFGNERQDYFSPAEVAAIRHLYQIAPAGSNLIFAAEDGQPSKYTDLESYNVIQISDAVVRDQNVNALEAQMRTLLPKRSFLMISKSQIAYEDMSSGLPPGSLERLESHLEHAPGFQVVYSNPDAKVFILKPVTAPARPVPVPTRPAPVAVSPTQVGPPATVPAPVRAPVRTPVPRRRAAGPNLAAYLAAAPAPASTSTPAAGLPPPLRLPLLVVFAVLAPGLPWARLLRPGGLAAELTLAIGLSLSVDIFVTAANVYAGIWSPWRCLDMIILITVAGALLALLSQFVQALRRWRAGTTQ